MKTGLKNNFLIIFYFILLLTLELIFWLNPYQCGLGFGILTYYLLFPLCIFIISIIYGKRMKNPKKYQVPLMFGFSVMLFEYSTYSLGNMLMFQKINMPEISLLFIYGAISLVGIWIGNIIKTK